MKKLTHILCIMMVVSPGLVLLTTRPILAQEKDVSYLLEKVSRLEARIKELEALLDARDDAQNIQATDEGGWQNKKNWRRLEMGMKHNQVRGILGDPTKRIEGVRILWYYPSKYCGYVYFDKEGLLTGWSEP